ncbi:hypothetical protein AGMMS50239_35060 [Bacteroidia bacterium]|nr:hypothetical protein AGMMS50239_35060 [Bacteroidia bacterium]
MIKDICKKIIADVARKDATHRVSTIIVAAMCILPSCNNYLDVVPDKYLTLETIYSRREEAVNALASVYYYYHNHLWGR